MVESTPSKTVGRVRFLALREPIERMHAAGHTLREIYARFGDQLAMSYSQLQRYAARYLPPAPPPAPGPGAGPGTGAVQAEAPPPAAEPAAPASDTTHPFRKHEKRKFTHDPDASSKDGLV